ncbi:MAG TPA: hypothetical protein VK050_06560 [Flavobacteriaceae bacterium]|nr:hypothetical protein [Flavobacteriaceae bacterium]
MKRFREKETEELKKYRNDFRDNFAYIESFCKKKFKGKFNLDLLSKQTNLAEICREEIVELIEQDYIRSNSYNFEIRPSVKNATDFLRKEILNEKIDVTYRGNVERAVFDLLKEIRDNLVHYGKFEVDDAQYDRNFILIKNATLITATLINEKMEDE